MYKAKRSNFNSYVVGYLVRNKDDNKIVGILNRANRFYELAWIDEKTIIKYCDCILDSLTKGGNANEIN